MPAVSAPVTYSPHAWGWTDQPQVLPLGELVFPTRVGMDRDRCCHRSRHSRIPHTRGDGPLPFIRFLKAVAYSPHAWGWTVAAAAWDRSPWVFPTRVGMDRWHSIPVVASCRIPHTRGDGPDLLACVLRATAYSPHAWGWTAQEPWESGDHQVFPTRVGMDRRSKPVSSAGCGIPHTRGDGPENEVRANLAK